MAPNGLELPTAPQGTLENVTVSTLADFRTQAAGAGKRITLTPGTYTEASTTPTGALTVTGSDLNIILTGCEINTPSSRVGLYINPLARRILITGGMINSGYLIDSARDYKLFDVSFEAPPTHDGSGNNGSATGHRGCFERCYSSLYNGGLFSTWSDDCVFTGSISGTTLTVTAVSRGALIDDIAIVVPTGTRLTQGLRIVDQISGTTGGVGEYQLNAAQTSASRTLIGRWRSTNIIGANSNLRQYSRGDGYTENPVRSNGAHLALIVDSRLEGDTKYTWRAQGDGSTDNRSGVVGAIRVQMANQGAMTEGVAGIHPQVEAVIFDDVQVYRPADVTGGGGSFGFPRYAGAVATTIIGNGTTATVYCNHDSRPGHGLQTGDQAGLYLCTNGAANIGMQTVTVVDELTFTIPHTFNGSTTGYANTTKPSTEFVFMRNCVSHSDSGTAGTGIVPSAGVRGSPPSEWATCVDEATSLANGNVFADPAEEPAWDFHETTPT